MRFTADGPNIPDRLLERRDKGRVVFLCGAGVSLPAGLPTFIDLAEEVVDFFDPPKGTTLADSFDPWRDDGNNDPKVPLDQIFQLLYQEYGREEVNSIVARRLQSDSSSKVVSKQHALVARISADRNGRPQVVTTNFDRLFEGIDWQDKPNLFEPPGLPDIGLGVPIQGVTYLHGRLQEVGCVRHPYVLSSADFGRAYLAEGWATRFVRSLLESYTVVLVGYQAEDPPVKYLLQGLNEGGVANRSELYAFDRGPAEEIEAKWRDRGVEAISYKEHSDLWDSLNAWADRADDPRAWRTGIIEAAQVRPSTMEPHERGQVVHLIRTAPGARSFSRAVPPCPAEWLCVFDVSCRIGKVVRDFQNDSVLFDPLDVYGLDDDPKRADLAAGVVQPSQDPLLEWRNGDTNLPGSHRICGHQPEGYEQMPSRLMHITQWIVSQIDCCTIAWWALRQRGLHPRLSEGIGSALDRRADVDVEARRFWRLVLEYQSVRRDFSAGRDWFDIKKRIELQGWSPMALLDFEKFCTPHLTRTPTHGLSESEPHLGSWHELNAFEAGRWEVQFPEMYGETIEVSDEDICAVFRIVEGRFHVASNLLHETQPVMFRVPSCYPDRDTVGDALGADCAFMFRWFLELIVRMAESHPGILMAHQMTWPISDRFIFRKLKLYCLNIGVATEAGGVESVLLEFDREGFWDYTTRRELLFLLSDRWESFTAQGRNSLADRILDGPPQPKHMQDDRYPQYRDELAVQYAMWLKEQGCDLSEAVASRLGSIAAGLDEGGSSSHFGVTTEHGGEGGFVREDEMDGSMSDIPASEIVEKAKSEMEDESDFLIDRRPFSGLVKSDPRKALMALSCSAKSGDYPSELWSALVENWPENTGPRLTRVFLHRLARLPEDAIREAHHSLGRWLQSRFKSVYEFDEDLAWNVLDVLVAGFVSGNGEAMRSGMGVIKIHGEELDSSRRTLGHAINGPIGEATEGMLLALGSIGLSTDQCLPTTFREQFERMINTPGEGGDHAVAVLAQQTAWLYRIDPDWVNEWMIPWFEFSNASAEPAWNGMLAAGGIPCSPIRNKMKSAYREVIPKIAAFGWTGDFTRSAIRGMIWMAVFRQSESDGLTKREARHFLRGLDDQARREVVFALGRIGTENEKGWAEYVIPFIAAVWPRERRYRTEGSTIAWLDTLFKTGDMFPMVYEEVRRFLVPAKRLDRQLYRLVRNWDDERSTAAQHPWVVLDLLDRIIPDRPDDAPHDLAGVLEFMEGTCSELATDQRFLRLLDLVEAR